MLQRRLKQAHLRDHGDGDHADDDKTLEIHFLLHQIKQYNWDVLLSLREHQSSKHMMMQANDVVSFGHNKM